MKLLDVLPSNSQVVSRIATSLAFLVLRLAGEVDASNSTSQNTRQKQDEQGDMIRGLAFGFGGFFGFVILLCIWWRCCCSSSSNNDDSCGCCKRKQNPRPQHGKTNGHHGPHGRGRIMGTDHKAKVSPSPPSSAISWSRNS